MYIHRCILFTSLYLVLVNWYLNSIEFYNADVERELEREEEDEGIEFFMQYKIQRFNYLMLQLAKEKVVMRVALYYLGYLVIIFSFVYVFKRF
jgi:hypothetical protein